MSKKFFELLNLKQEIVDKLTLVKGYQISEDDEKFGVHLQATEVITPEEMLLIIKGIQNSTLVKISLSNFKLDQPKDFEEEAHIIYGYIYQLAKKLDASINMSTIIVEKNGDDFSVFYTSQATKEIINKIEKPIITFMKNFGIVKKQIAFFWDDSKFELSKRRDTVTKKVKEIEEHLEQISFKQEPIKGYKLIKPNLVEKDLEKIYFEGTIFKFEARDVKNNMTVVTIGVSNGEQAIYGKQFLRRGDEVPQLNNGDYIRIYGNLKYSSYSNSYEINVDILEPIDNSMIAKKDICNAKEKRAELHIHTKMSQMDGVSTPAQYFETASQMGLTALAFTDHNVVHSFPDIYKASKKHKDIKAIYGVEFDVYDDTNAEIVKNSKSSLLGESEYVFFDLETTGLSAFVNEIIEFGAVKVKNGQIIDKMQIFIKPSKKIPANITKITGIKQEHVENSKTIKQEIKNIFDFFGDAVLVAHNAEFDISFIETAYRNNGLPRLNNPVIDTLKISWLINKDLKNHRLGTLARKLGIAYDDMVSHRALYDSEVLHETFDNLVHKLYELDIRNIDQLNEHVFEIRENFFPKHVTALAKNEKGLKTLYRLISDSSTSHFNKTKGSPLLPLSVLLKHRENLLLGSSCSNGFVWDAVVYNEEFASKKFEMFDYIEIFPPEVYDHLVISEKYSREEIIKILKKIEEMSDLLDKKIVATSNAHYSSKEMKIARDVYIANKGIGGKPHRMFNYQNPQQTNPDQHLRSTQEMLEIFTPIFGREKALKIVVENTNFISCEIEEVKPVQEGLYAPKIENADKELTELVYSNLKKTYGTKIHVDIKERLEKELNAILTHGYGIVYYLSSKIVRKSLSEGVLVGSRGSVGSSLVATMAEITEVNPLQPHYICPKCQYHEFDNSVDDGFDLPKKKCPECGASMKGEGHNIPFETFLGFEADKIPDIDLNFSEDQQSLIHDYVRELLGHENVFRAGTISTSAARQAYGYVKNYLEIMNKESEYKPATIDYISSMVEGVKRTTGQHPGGIIVVPSDKEIYDFTPINFPGNDHTSDWKTTHFDFDTIHDNLLKLDILGHVDPSVLKMLHDLTGKDPLTIPMNDPKVISLFSTNEELKFTSSFLKEKTGVVGIPEFRTEFVREMLKSTNPKSFADLIRISGLSHGTNVWSGNAKDLIEKGTAELKDVISVRDGIMTYLISKGLDNKTSFNITEDVRKGRGVKPDFEFIMKKQGVPEWYIESCKKIKYMFPKAHATAYVIMAYRVAWYKINFPLEFYATYFTKRGCEFDLDSLFAGPEGIIGWMEKYKSKSSKDITDRDTTIYQTYEVVLEMFSRGYNILPISLISSRDKQWLIVKDKNGLLPPFNIIEGLGEIAARKLVDERIDKPFSSIKDFEERSGVNKTIMEKIRTMGLLSELPNEQTEQATIFDFMK